jgi:hypothetical protein
MRESVEGRFWAKVDVRGADECWPWLAGRNEDGYGVFHVSPERHVVTASRFAWELANGKRAPADKKVCHSCDNPPCCNQAHLWLGTPLDNIRDRDAKNRRVPWNRGATSCKRGHALATSTFVRTASGDSAASDSLGHMRAFHARQRTA